MFKTASEVVKFIKENDVKFLDVRFTDLPGVQQHFNLPAAMIDEQFFIDGQLLMVPLSEASLPSTSQTCS